MNAWIDMPSRRVLRIVGKQAAEFLQGMVTCDVHVDKPAFGAMLTPTGRFKSDFFLIPGEEEFWIDCHKDDEAFLVDFLGKMGLFYGVFCERQSHLYAVCVAYGANLNCFNMPDALTYYADPRGLPMVRTIMPYSIWLENPHIVFAPQKEDFYHRKRIEHGVAESHYDLIRDKSIILLYGYHHWGAICWKKGCYVGQELMARTFHQGQIHSRLGILSLVSGVFPARGSPLYQASEKIGVMAGSVGSQGLASLHHTVENGQYTFVTSPDGPAMVVDIHIPTYDHGGKK